MLEITVLLGVDSALGQRPYHETMSNQENLFAATDLARARLSLIYNAQELESEFFGTSIQVLITVLLVPFFFPQLYKCGDMIYILLTFLNDHRLLFLWLLDLLDVPHLIIV